MIKCILGSLHDGKETIVGPFIQVINGCRQEENEVMTFDNLCVETIGNEHQTLVIIATC